MPHCQHCKQQWNRGTTLRSSFTLGEGMQCPQCGTTQFLTKQSRKKIAIANLFPAPLLIGSAWFFDLEIVAMLVITLVLFAVYLGAYPYMVELSDKNEPMW